MRRRLIVALACVLACGFVALNHDLPIVRNSLVYARASENVIAHGFDPRAVVADSTLSYDKPIGFAWLASPFVAAFGNHLGLEVTSLLGTLAYLFAAWLFLRAFDPFGLSERERALALLFCGLTPLVAYQAWSAHPDSLFAALYLTTFALTRKLVEHTTPLRIVLWSATIFCAVLLKNYGMVLLPSVGLYLMLHVRTLWSATNGRRSVALIALAFVLLSVVVALGWTGHNPLMRFEGEGGGVGQYGQGDHWLSARGTFVQVAIALALNLHFALLAIFRKTSVDRRVLLALACFPVPYVLGLILFPTTFYNMRYFIPLFPFAALLAVAGLRETSSMFTKLVTRGFVVIAALLVLVFNVEPLHARVDRFIPKLEVNWIGTPLSLLDNLRMPLIRKEKAWIDNLNANVPDGGVVYLPDVTYYRDARHGVYERAGLIRPGIATRYVRSRDLHPDEPQFWVQGPLRDPPILFKLGAVTDLGLDLYQIDSAHVETSTSR